MWWWCWQQQAGKLWQLSAHTHTFPKVLLKVLLNPLMGGSDPEFRKISEDLLISAAVPGFSYELVCEKTKVCC